MQAMGGHSRLRARIAVVVAAGALLVAAGVALLLSDATQLRSSDASASHADMYLLRVVDLERLVVDAETGLRGKVITNQDLFLDPLYRAQAQLPAAATGLERAAAQNHTYERQTAALVGAARYYMSTYVPGVLKLAAHNLPAARSLFVTLAGKREVDVIRARAAALEHAVSTSQARRQHAARQTANRSIADAIIVLVLLTLLTIALGAFLGHLVVGRERARAHSEETSRILQQSTLPTAMPVIPGCELAAQFIPSGDVVSGDFYDVVEIDGGGWALVIGDVCGKGTQAAAATAMARWTLRSSLAQGATPAEALTFLNGVALRQDLEGRFITAACLKLTLEPDHAQIAVACAGHPAPILVPRRGVPTAVDTRGDLLGITPRIRLHTAEIQLQPGDSVVAYTDGVTDQGPEHRRTPEDALRDRASGAGAEQLARILVDLAQQPAGEHPDDIAIVALRFLGENVGTPEPSPGAGVPQRV